MYDNCIFKLDKMSKIDKFVRQVCENTKLIGIPYSKQVIYTGNKLFKKITH